MSETEVIIGPPGTGKTTVTLNRIERLMADGVSSHDIAFLSFSRAAVNEAKSRAARRFNLDPDTAFPNFRTIHSMAKRYCNDRGQVMDDAQWKNFSEVCHYEFSEVAAHPELDGTFYSVLDTAGDQLRQVNQLARLCRISLAEAIRRVPTVHILSAEHAREFSRRLRDYKDEHHLLDFTDMLELALTVHSRPPVEYAFVDEAQDCCRLHHELFDHWFRRSSTCRLLTLVGDDDQAIHVWAGADPQLLVDAAATYPTTVLDQSHRIPALAHRAAMSVTPWITHRVAKVYRPREAKGQVSVGFEVRDVVDAARGESAMFLLRNHYLAKPVAAELITRGEVFSSEVGPRAPLERPKVLHAWRAIRLLLRGEGIRADELVDLLDHMPTRHDGDEILPRGVKKLAKSNTSMVPLERLRMEFGLGHWFDILRRLENPFDCLMRLQAEERQYLDTVAQRLSGFHPRDELRVSITVTTMHRSKGREAHTVAIQPAMAGASYRQLQSLDPDDASQEHRVAYVALTRVKEHLILLGETSRRTYPYRSHVA